jgi:hypothetical protein
MQNLNEYATVVSRSEFGVTVRLPNGQELSLLPEEVEVKTFLTEG